MSSTTRNVREQHAALDRQVELLRSLIAGDFGWDRIDGLLADLQESVKSHFEFEEHGGYLTEVAKRYPHREGEIDRLRKEHQLMTAMLRRARRFAIDRTNPDQLRRVVGSWIMLFSDHEATENELMQMAFRDDENGID